MLMSDTWQPAVLQLLPFSSNDASNPQPPASTPRLRSFPFPDHSRGFPVLAVTRRERDIAGSEVFSQRGRSSGPQGAGQQRARAVSERMTRSQTFVDPAPQPSNPRAKSDYHPRRSGTSTTYGKSRPNGNGLASRDQATCSVTDLNERIIPKVGLRPESSSPDSSSGSLRNSPHVATASAESLSPLGGNGGNSRGLPKPAFPSNALSPSNNSAVGVIGSGNGNATVEGRYMVSKNGMWRAVSMTPGEMELKKHRDLLERVSTAQSPVSMDNKSGRHYHKMNIRDLPRSTTPVNDHDPDKLNMKQVIAFLQSKGKSQADAVELPRGMKVKVNQSVTFPRHVKSGVMRGSVRKAPASSTAAEIIMRSSGRHHHTAQSVDASSLPLSPQKGESEDVLKSSSTSMPSVTTDRQTARSWKSSGREGKESSKHKEHKDHGTERLSLHGEASPRKFQKKPFRLHRFLTMVPTARDSGSVASAPLPSNTTQPVDSQGPQEVRSSSKPSARKERTLCLDLASQSKSMTPQSKGESADTKAQAKVHYRLTASRPRPSSLRVEQDVLDTQLKLSADFGDRDSGDKAIVVVDAGDNIKKETKNVIRLPFVMVDSEDEEVGLSAEVKRPNRNSARQKYATPTKSSQLKTQTVKKKAAQRDILNSDAWPTDVTENPVLQSSSQLSVSSSTLPPQVGSSGSLISLSHVSDTFSDQVQDDTPDGKLPEMNADNGLIRVMDENGLPVGANKDKPLSSKSVKVSIPSQKDAAKQNGEEGTKRKSSDRVTLSLRKERHRTRERTYMSEIAGSDVFSDDTCAARVNSESVRMSLRSDDMASWAS